MRKFVCRVKETVFHTGNRMDSKTESERDNYEVVEPLGNRLLIRKDEDKNTTSGGIVLPDNAKVPVITARVMAISPSIEDDFRYPLHQYDKVIVNPENAIPVDIEQATRGDQGNNLFIVPIEDVVGVFRRPGSGEDDDVIA